MKIIADQNIPQVEQAFALVGDLQAVEKREIVPLKIKDADILLVRSEVKVNEDLLGGSEVKFVATPTAGIDHIDLEYLKSKNIGFAHAPGCNSNSVAEYIAAALLLLCNRKQIEITGMTIGIVGVGHVGSKVAAKARALGMNVLLCDPPKQRETGDSKYLPLEQLMNADFISLHVPLIKSGPDATHHLFDETRIGKMKKDSILLNSSRGSVVKTSALKNALVEKYLSGCVLDVWEGEPNIDIDLLKLVDLGTPHIAGYSYDGKLKGTQMIHDAVCEYFGVEKKWSSRSEISNVVQDLEYISEKGIQNELYNSVKRFYNIEKDDTNLRKALSLSLSVSEQGDYFYSLRWHYRIRREFYTSSLNMVNAEKDFCEFLKALGFQIL